MVDVQGLKDRLTEQAAAAHELAVEAVIQTLADAAPFDTGALRAGVVEVETDRAGPVMHSRIESTARSDEGVDYGRVQNDGTGPIFGNPLLHFQIGGVDVFVHSTSGVPATHWWDGTITADLWRESLSQVL